MCIIHDCFAEVADVQTAFLYGELEEDYQSRYLWLRTIYERD